MRAVQASGCDGGGRVIRTISLRGIIAIVLIFAWAIGSAFWLYPHVFGWENGLGTAVLNLVIGVVVGITSARWAFKPLRDQNRRDRW